MLFTRGVNIWPFSFWKSMMVPGQKHPCQPHAVAPMLVTSSPVFDKSVIDSMMLIACWFLLLNQRKGGIIYKIAYLFYFFGYGEVCLVPVWLSHVKLTMTELDISGALSRCWWTAVKLPSITNERLYAILRCNEVQICSINLQGSYSLLRIISPVDQ